MFKEERCGFLDKKGWNRLRFLRSPGFMPSALDWNLHGCLRLLRFRRHQIHVRFRCTGHLHLHMVWPDKIVLRCKLFHQFHFVAYGLNRAKIIIATPCFSAIFSVPFAKSAKGKRP
jgi:hypothetical protein